MLLQTVLVKNKNVSLKLVRFIFSSNTNTVAGSVTYLV